MVMIYTVRPIQSFYKAAFINSVVKDERKWLNQNNRELWNHGWNFGGFGFAAIWGLQGKQRSHTENCRSRWGVYKPWRPPAHSMKRIDWRIQRKATSLYWFHLLNPHELWGKNEDGGSWRETLKRDVKPKHKWKLCKSLMSAWL